MNILNHCLIPDWPAPANVKALQTTRLGGISSAPYDSLNLGDHVGDAPLAVARNRMLLHTLLPSEPVWLEQVHGTVVVNADLASCLPQADACIARHRDAVCVVMTADCLPVLLCDTRGCIVGAAHAGWKGLAAGVIEAAVQAMDVTPQNLMAWMGPAISQPAFEVGGEVRAIFVGADPKASAAFIPGQNGKWQADLYALARLRLNALGITKIYGGGDCDTLLRSSRLREQSPAAPPAPDGSTAPCRGGDCDTLLRSSRLREQSPAAPPAPDGSTAPCRGGDCDTLLRSSRLREQSPAAPPAPDGSTAPCRGGYCTYRERERFFSHRRDGITGRMGTFIWLD